MALLNGAPFRAIVAKLGLYLIAVLLVGEGEALAQVLYGSLVGSVKDTSGAAVPGAEVTITHRESNLPRSMTTDDTGANIVSKWGPTYRNHSSKDKLE
jgi:hypothetical protein